MENWLRRLVSGVLRQRWLIVIGLSGAAVAVIIIATVDPHGPIAAGLVAAAAVAAIVPIVGPPVARLTRKGPALEVPVTPVFGLGAYDLGVHPAVLPEEHDADRLGPTPYLRRSHDSKLDNDIMQAAAGGRSIFAVLVGQSTTGKTRALFEALNRESAVRDWPLFRPADARELAALLTQQRIGPRTALWLDETQQYLHGESGSRAARLLARLLTGTTGIIVVGAMWVDYWNDLTGKGAVGDPNAAARELLERSAHRIDVADHLEEAEVQELSALGKSDRRVAAAAAAAGTGGQVIQNLTGGPELLARYVDGGLFSAIEHALITAALDARRLGHESSLPADLLTAAADGYITDNQRPDPTAWVAALTAITGGKRADARNTPTAVRTLTALTTHRVRGQTDPDYQPSDFLDQHTRRLRQACLGPAALWDALTAYAVTASDLKRLAGAARDRGLYRYAADLWTNAATLGSTDAARQLITHLRQVSLTDATRAARWAAVHASLDDPWDVTELLRALRAAGASDAVATLMARDPASHASLDDPGHVAFLMLELRAAGAGDAAAALATRAAGHASLDDPRAVAMVLEELCASGAGDAVGTLLARDPAAHVSLDDPGGVDRLLRALAEAGAGDAVATLATRAVLHVSLDDPRAVGRLLGALRKAGADDAVAALLARDLASHASLDDPAAVTWLLGALRAAGACDAITALLARDPAAHVSLDDPGGVAELLRALRAAGAGDAVTTLLARDPASHASPDNPYVYGVVLLLRELCAAGAGDAAATLATRAAHYVSPDDPSAVAVMLRALREAGAGDAVTTLATRVADHTSPDKLYAVTELLEELREAGASDAVTTLATRAAKAGMFPIFLRLHPDKDGQYPFGREPDGAPSQTWNWQEPTS